MRRHAALILIFRLQLCLRVAMRLRDKRLVLFIHILEHIGGIELVAVLMVEARRFDLPALLGDERLQLLFARGGSRFHLPARLSNGVRVGLCARRDALAVKVDAAGGDVVQLYDRAAGRGLAAAGLAHQTENLAALDVEGDVVNSLNRLKVLTQMVDLQQNFFILIRH